MHLIGEQSPAEHDVVPRTRFIGLGITGDVARTLRVPIRQTSPSRFLPSRIFQERERKREIEKRREECAKECRAYIYIYPFRTTSPLKMTNVPGVRHHEHRS